MSVDTNVEVRLQCLKLAGSMTRDPNEVIALANIFTSYVLADEPDTSVEEPGDKPKRGRPKLPRG